MHSFAKGKKINLHTMKLSWQIIQLNLKEVFSISYGNYSFRNALIIQLSQNNISGFGECTEIDYYQINLQDFSKKLVEIQANIETQKISHPTEFYQFLVSLQLPSFLRSALDCAYWDLYGKLENKSFFELCHLNPSKNIESSITISVAPIEEQIQKIETSSWNKFKVKCKGLDKNSLHKLLNLNRNIALDSNASFTEEDCIWIQNQEFTQYFTYLEQPMGINHYHVLNKNHFANWMADEDSQNDENLSQLLPHYRSINIKLQKCGGITPTLDLVKKCRELGFKLMIGCMTESSIGISAGIAVSALFDYADLDGATLISNDIAQGHHVENGKLIFSEKAGLGIKIKA